MKARQVLNEVFTPSKNFACRLLAWEVRGDKRFSENFKYAFVLLHENERVLAYDNCEGKGHHRHYGKQQGPNTGTPEIKSKKDIEKLARTFMTEVTAIIKKTKNE
ncbi:MAG: DUF6516 family protein [Candidatus Micrarchaeota archaeon]